jgi:phosphopantothenoylcysteine decarboxylase/phosphopantothenate--cysteine ligase
LSRKPSRILVGVAGSIAAVKATDVVRSLREAGHDVHCVMTESATQFVSPLALATFSGHPVHFQMFGPEAYQMPHLTLSAQADVMVIVAASAATLARCAHGLADDLVSLCYITTTAPVVIAPAMHDTMWAHAATQENVKTLKSRGVVFAGPIKGMLADQTTADGRMIESADLLAVIEKTLEGKKK